MLSKLQKQGGLRWQWHLLLFLVCAAAVASRRLSLLNHPTFYAEDGAVWFLDAYSLGWIPPLFSPQGGYLNTLPRLVAAVTLLVPFAYAPLFMNMAGIIVQVLPVNVLLLRRSNVWGSLPLRALQALVYMLLPNVEEIHVVITNAHFHLALLSFLLLVAHAPRTRLVAVLDIAVLTVSGLTGPFCFGLLLVAIFIWWKKRSPWSLLAVSIQAVSVLIQGAELVFGPGRPAPHLGASLNRFIRIVGVQVYTGALLGRGAGGRWPFWVVAVVAICGTAVVLYCLWKAHLELKLFICLASILFAAALWKPLSAAGPGSGWVGLANGSWSRYWFFPMLAFSWCLVSLATQSKKRHSRWAAGLVLLLMIRGAVHDWHFREFANHDFPKSARLLGTANEGDLLQMNLVPAGWSLHMNKKGSLCNHPPISSAQPVEISATPRGIVDLGGWIVAAEPIQGVAVEADGRVLTTALMTVPRPDLDAFYPVSTNRTKGWAAQVDRSSLPPGPHQITLRAVEEHGCRAVIGSLVVTASRP